MVAIGGGWLALRLTGSLNWLFAALAFGRMSMASRSRRRSYQEHGWSRAKHKCARLANN